MKFLDRARNISVVTKYTFSEIVQSKIILNTFILGLALLIITFIASSFTYGNAARIAIDFGIGASSLATIGIAIFMGVSLISEEIHQRTVYIVLSRPITRVSFILGKLVGMIGVLGLNILILSSFSIIIFVIHGGSIDSLILFTFLFNYIEACLILLLVVLLSLITNKIMAVLISITLFILGHAVPDALALISAKKQVLLYNILKFYSLIFPDLSRLNIKDFVLYKHHLDFDYLLSTLGYGFGYSALLLIILCSVFHYKNLD